MRNRFTHPLCVVAFAALAICLRPHRLAAQTAPATKPAAVEPAAILDVMQRVADWQLANPAKYSPTDWTQAAGYAGMMALAGISPDDKYHDAMMEMAAGNEWKLGPRHYHADDHAVGATYLELFALHRRPEMIAPLRARFDQILENPPANADDLDIEHKLATQKWSWCDSLFMAPPTWARLYAATGERKYLDYMNDRWWHTTDYLYDPQEHLYFRDSRYFDRREKNGEKVFWSRGNGWVLAGLVRVLQAMPSDYPDREKYVELFREMTNKLRDIQPKDGLWRVSLLDPDSYPAPETSGTGFFTYAMAWGINQGILDRPTFEPTVIKAWQGLVGNVNEAGRLGGVQPIAADPFKIDADHTDVYAVGGFLLAGSEVYKMTLLEDHAHAGVTIKNPLDLYRRHETLEIDADMLAEQMPDLALGDVMVMSGDSARIVPSQMLDADSDGRPETLLFQTDIAPTSEERFLLVAKPADLDLPEPTDRTFARYVPERMDDFAWENDRIAFRMYGPALIEGEGTISSGIDVWLKSTPELVVNDWYKSGHYHEDHGQGLDAYKVGPTRGCGGLGIWADGKLWVSSNYTHWKVLANGPIRSTFELTYDAWDADGRSVSETKRISLDAGSNLNRIQSTFTADGTEPLTLGVGIVMRDGDGKLTKNPDQHWMSYWEPEAPPHGHTACAVVVPGGASVKFEKTPTDFLLLTQAEPGTPFVYYAGAGWSKSGQFPDADAWENDVTDFAKCAAAPLEVTITGP